MTKYVRICKSLTDFGKLVPVDDVYDVIDDPNVDWYKSLYYYNDEHLKQFKNTGSVAGIKDVVTNQIVFDFDNEDNPEESRKDALDIVTRLLSLGLKQDEINVYFSGNKGFSIEIETTSTFTPNELKNLAKNIAGDFKTFDSKIYNPSRIFRIPFTRHNKTGLFKIPLRISDLSDLTIDKIKELAKDPSNIQDYCIKQIILPDEILELFNKNKVNSEINHLEMRNRPNWLSPCKFAILNGYFNAGSRNHSLMALAATIKSQGLPKEVAYRMLKGSAELQSKRTGQEPFSKEEIWNNIIEVVYGPNWQGATYSCKDHDFLRQVCPAKNTTTCYINKALEVVTIDQVQDKFIDYATNIEKNTVKLGMRSVDDKIRLQTCSHVVIAASSGTGKTSLILNILNNISHAGSNALFASLDMNHNLIMQKLCQRVTGLDDRALYKIYQTRNMEKINEIHNSVKEEFKNVMFDFRSGVTIEELRQNILGVKHKVGDKLKLVVIDFINRIRGPYGDETANLSYIAPRLSDLANETETLIISLAQTARNKGSPSTPLMDSRISKGSSAIEESATVVFGISRPGYMMGSDDKYMRIGVLKTRMGKEFVEHLYFNGLTSEVRDLTPDEQNEFKEFMERLEKEKEDEKKNFKGDPW